MLSTLPAQAQTRVVCGFMLEYNACLTDNTNTTDIVLVLGPDGGERITIDCSNSQWNSHGPNTQEFVQSIVDSYCN